MYGIWLFADAHADTRTRVHASQLAKPDPPELILYIEPPVNINTANSAELQLLPSIGPVLAGRMLAYRERHGPFRSLDALRNVRGIGPETIKKLRYYFEIDN